MKSSRSLLCALVLLASTTASAETTLRIGLQDDPDALDPARGRTYAGRMIFAALCDKLVEVTPALTFVPQLATAWTWSADDKVLTMTLRQGVTFQDGEPFDAEAVKFNLDRYRTLPDSLRKSELASIASVEAVDPTTVKITLKQPDATLIAQFSDRGGMMLSPKASKGDVSLKPVCSGPYKFVQRVQQDRIVLDRFEGYWNKQAYHFDKVIFLAVPDTAVRLANLRSGDLDIIERPAPTDVKSIKADKSLQLFSTPGLGYSELIFNLANGERAKTPIGQDKRIRQAFEASIDRATINDVVFEGLYTASNQPFPPSSVYSDKALPVPGRNVDKAKALLAAAGVKTPLDVDFLVPNSPVFQQVAQIIQAMASEAGFNVKINATDTATLLSSEQAGRFQVSMQYWSGRPDPDGNIHQFVTCHGSQDDSRYCNAEVDALLNKARTVNDQAQRQALYKDAFRIFSDDVPTMYLYFEPRLVVMKRKFTGFVPNPDGLIRLTNITAAP